MYLVIFYRENNEKHLVYHLNVSTYMNYKVGTYNSYNWLVLANLTLYNGVFYNKKMYHSILLFNKEKTKLEDRKRAKKIEKRNKLVELLKDIKNGI